MNTSSTHFTTTKNTPVSAVELKLTEHIDKSVLRYITNNIFTVPEQYLDLYQKYLLLYWEGSYLKNKINLGTIQYNYIPSCSVIFQNCTPEKAYKAAQVRLSFRVPKPEFGIYPVVLIQIARN